MRWDRLFADLEAQLAESDRADFSGEVADRTEQAIAQVPLLDRLRAHRGHHVTVGVRAAADPGSRGGYRGELVDLAAQWLLLADGARQVLVPLSSLAWVRGLGSANAPAGPAVLERRSLLLALRRIARDRSPVLVDIAGARLAGTIDRVAADHLDLAEHPWDEPRRARAVRSVCAVPLAALSAVLSA